MQKRKGKWSALKDLITPEQGAFDPPFMVLVLVLLVIGLLMLFSASMYTSIKENDGNPYVYLSKQLMFAVIGLAAMLFMSKVNLKFLRKLSWPALIVATGLLVLVLFYYKGTGDFKRWIPIPIIGQIQPSEIAKLSLILFFAYAMDQYQKSATERKSLEPTASKFAKWMIKGAAPWVLLGILAMFGGLILLEKHLSGMIITLGIGATMFFIGEQKFSTKMYVLIGVCAVAVVLFFLNKPELLGNYWSARIISFKDVTSDPQGDGWQTIQSLNAIGSGGLFGQGPGQS
jgi:cell division protein FtsW